MNARLNDQLLQEFAHKFYGYGSYAGKFWFIGMEEGGGNSVEAIQSRLEIWEKRGKRELEDLLETAREAGGMKFFNERAKLQPTWNKLIRIVLASQGQVPTTEQVRQYQRGSLGRHDGENCLLELLPLPSPSTRHWIYGKHSQLPFLKDRESYHAECIPCRCDQLKDRINRYRPKVVVFHGTSYQAHWRKVAAVEFYRDSDVDVGRTDSTLFVIVKHPAAKGVTSAYFHSVGQLIARLLSVGDEETADIEASSMQKPESDLEFLKQFESTTLPFEQWTHRAHVKVAFLYLREHPFDVALAKMRASIQNYIQAHRVPAGPNQGYHETTTHAFMQLVHTTMQAFGEVLPTPDADTFCDTHPQLLSKYVLRLFYSPARRSHPDAKSRFVEPDLAPLPQVNQG